VANDGIASVTNSFEVVVTEVNVAPVFAVNPPNTSVAEGSLLTVTNNATDSDVPAHEPYVFAGQRASWDASISTNGVITWTPGEAQGPGTNTLDDSGERRGGERDEQLHEVVVTEVNVAPVFAGTRESRVCGS
jgi:hypothetical protein